MLIDHINSRKYLRGSTTLEGLISRGSIAAHHPRRPSLRAEPFAATKRDGRFGLSPVALLG
jgi:hypothetical protein